MFIIIQDISKSPIAAEQQEDIANSNAACCDDGDDNVLSDEALDKLDKELEAESLDEKELCFNRSGNVLNGSSEEEIHEVVSFLYWIMHDPRWILCNLIQHTCDVRHELCGDQWTWTDQSYITWTILILDKKMSINNTFWNFEHWKF